MKSESLFVLIDKYKKSKFNPKEYKWLWETDMSGNYSLLAEHKKDKEENLAWDGAKNLDTIKAACKLLNVRPKEKK